MKTPQNIFKGLCLGGGLLIASTGCVPAPDHDQTKILPVSDLKITMTEAGQAEVSQLAEEDTPVDKAATVEPAEDKTAAEKPAKKEKE